MDPVYGPILMSKLDITNGFYRICIAPHDILKLGVLLPRLPSKEAIACSLVAAYPLLDSES